MTTAIVPGQHWRDKLQPRRLISILEAGPVHFGVATFKIKTLTMPNGAHSDFAVERITSENAIRENYDIVGRRT